MYLEPLIIVFLLKLISLIIIDYYYSYYYKLGRRGGLMVSVLESGLKGLGSRPGLALGHRHLTLTVPLST